MWWSIALRKAIEIALFPLKPYFVWREKRRQRQRRP